MVAAGFAYALIFPPWNQAWLAWIAVAPLLVVLRAEPRIARCALLGWAFGACATVAASFWTAPSLIRGFGFPVWAAALVTLGTMAFYGGFFGLFAGLAAWLRRRAWPFAPAVAVAWTASEYARAQVASGLPWLLLGHSQHGSLAVLQLAEVAGVAGISLVLVSVNACVVEALVALRERAPRRAWVYGSIALALPLATLLFGALRLRAVEQQPGGAELRVGLVQAAVPQDERWREDRRRRNLERHLELTRRAVADGAQLVIWGETAIDYPAEEIPGLSPYIAAALGRDPDRRLIAGVQRLRIEAGEPIYYNSAALYDGTGRVLGFYDKIHLLPIAESEPAWVRWVPGARAVFGTMLEGLPYAPGTESDPFETPWARVGVMICFESIYPELAREAASRGADLLVNITNDAFFAGDAALEQHFALTVFRAVETRRPLARVANSGIGALVKATGRVQQWLAADATGYRVVSVAPRSGRTAFLAWGHWLPAVVSAGLAFGLLTGRQR